MSGGTHPTVSLTDATGISSTGSALGACASVSAGGAPALIRFAGRSPLALQGIWNDGLASSMAWTDDFHLDINTQQNYWPAEVCNLAECQMPLFQLIDLLRAKGRETAKDMYGAPGWVVHTVTNPWGFGAPATQRYAQFRASVSSRRRSYPLP
jgi:hypothetical protein